MLEFCTMRARRAKASSPEASSGTDAGGGGGISLRFGGGAKLGGGAKFPGADYQYFQRYSFVWGVHGIRLTGRS